MGKIITILFFLLFLGGHAQEGFKIILLDSKGHRDTVIFGMDNAATSGIDNGFNEVNIYGTSLKSLEIRSVQRTSANHLCLRNSTFENSGEPFYFPTNLDLKRDFRKFQLFSPTNNFFEFTVNATDYPIKIISDFTESLPIGIWYIWVGTLNSECGIVSSSNANRSKIDTIFIDNEKSVKSIIIKFDHEVSINEIRESKVFELYPNPVTDKSTLVINQVNTETAIISIYTITGNLVYTRKLNGQKRLEINKSKFETGLYLLRYNDQEGYNETCKMMIK